MIRKIINFVFGFMWGLTLGAIVALLTTPQDGESFRAELVNWWRETSAQWQILREESRAQLQQQLVNRRHGLNN